MNTLYIISPVGLCHRERLLVVASGSTENRSELISRASAKSTVSQLPSH